jgi:hypothetical protein
VIRASVAARFAGLLVVAASQAWGQGVILQIKPHAGDTIRMLLDQRAEMTGVKHTSAGEATAMVVNTLKMFSRAIVEGVTERGTAVLAVTDSALMSTTDEQARPATLQAQAAMRGQRVQFRVLPDGTVGMSEAGGASRDVAQVISVMPATFPKAPINVGESWIREMPLPAGTQFGAQLSGKLYITFRFDSLTHNGDWAFVSMRGEMRPTRGPGAVSGTILERGLVTGTMLVDQRRGWLTESWFQIAMSSLVTPPIAAGLVSMHTDMRITQHMRTLDRR